MYVRCFGGHNAIAHLTDHSNLLYAVGTKKFFSLTLLWYSLFAMVWNQTCNILKVCLYIVLIWREFQNILALKKATQAAEQQIHVVCYHYVVSVLTHVRASSQFPCKCMENSYKIQSSINPISSGEVKLRCIVGIYPWVLFKFFVTFTVI